MTEQNGATATAAELSAWLRDARTRTLAVIDGLSDEELIGAFRETVNPILWALGHVAWFHENWALRHLRGLPSLMPGNDELYNSFEVAHETRWELALPSRAATLAYLDDVLAAELERLAAEGPPTARSTYFHRLVVFHEDMHDEAMLYDRQNLGYSEPPFLAADPCPTPPAAPLAAADADIPGKRGFMLGGTPAQGFLFDNEKWAHPVDVAPFRMAATPVTNGQFAEFVEAGGYHQPEHWSLGGRLFLRRYKPEYPLYWRHEGGGRWLRRSFEDWLPLREHNPVLNVCWYEAEAYCNWAGRRLPTEAEWELAATAEPTPAGEISDHKRTYPWGEAPPTPERANLDAHYSMCVDTRALPAGDSAFGVRQMVGNVWEWTADPFYPYPGFEVDPYREYSAPWFGYHKVLRGGAWATRGRMIRNTWRNFFMPDRRDVLAGFRTCAR